jgi:chaperonin GroEL (HSP60 family)
MTETTTAATKAKTTKPAASSFIQPDFGMPKFEMPKFDMPTMEMPEAFREMAEKGVEHTRDACAKAKVASEEAADVLENTYGAAAKHASDSNRKLIEIARTNTRAAGDDGSIVVGKILEKGAYAFGYDAQTGEYGNLVSKGIIDPTKVVRVALQGAASIASLLITTEAMVAELPSKQSPAMPGGPGGGMGGMDF